MKTFLFSFLIFLCLSAQSQITFDFECQMRELCPIPLTENEIKYLDYNEEELFNQDKFELYYLDGTLFKSIVLPPKPGQTSQLFMTQITRSLFDNDPSNIEYMVIYYYDSIPNSRYVRTKIIREDGTVLMDEMNGNYPQIFNTEQGTKLKLSYSYANGQRYNTKFFDLPGTLPTLVDQEKEFPETSLSVYPNPNNGDFFIQFNSKGGNENVLELYSSRGKLIDTYNSGNDKLHITNYGLNEGLYLLRSQSDKKNRMTKMIIKK